MADAALPTCEHTSLLYYRCRGGCGRRYCPTCTTRNGKHGERYCHACALKEPWGKRVLQGRRLRATRRERRERGCSLRGLFCEWGPNPPAAPEKKQRRLLTCYDCTRRVCGSCSARSRLLSSEGSRRLCLPCMRSRGLDVQIKAHLDALRGHEARPCEVEREYCTWRGRTFQPNPTGTHHHLPNCSACGRRACRACSVKVREKQKARVTTTCCLECLPTALPDGQKRLRRRMEALEKGLRDQDRVLREKDHGAHYRILLYSQSTREDLAADMRRVAKLEGRQPGVAPSMVAYRKWGKYGMATAIHIATKGQSKRWTEATKAMKLKPAPRRGQVPIEAHLEEVRRVAMIVTRRAGYAADDTRPRMPTTQEFEELSRFHPWTTCKRICTYYEAREVTWTMLARVMGYAYEHLAAPQGSVKKRAVQDYQRAMLDLRGAKPNTGAQGVGMKQFARWLRGAYTAQAVQSHYGTWSNFVRAAGFVPNPKGVKVGPETACAA